MITQTNAFIIANDQFLLDVWVKEWPEATIIAPEKMDPIKNPSIIIIVAKTDSWLEIIKKYAQMNVPALVLSRHGDIEELNTAMQAGAKGYMNLFSPVEKLKLAAESIINGAFWMPPKYLENLLRIANQSIVIDEANNALECLSKREMEVSELVTQGLSNKKIAAELGICERTVKLHMSSILSKLNISDRIQLILLKKGKL